MKSKLRKLADGGSPNPSMLGLADGGSPPRRSFEPVVGTRSPVPSGGGGGLSRAAVAAAQNPPAPPPPARTGIGALPADPLRNPRAILDAREKAAGLADGGGLMDRVRNFINPPDDRTDTDIAAGVPKPGSPEENKELARRVTQQPGMFPTYSRSRLRADMNAEYQQRKKDAGPATGLADGGTYLGDEYNTNLYQQSQLRDGGRVDGPGGRTDDKVGPVMLSDEEYVLPGDTADAIGRDKLDAIRLATHEFKDERKESALRGRTDDVPVDHLADGGNPWIVDSKGTVRPNAFGDAAAGPGYTQPRLPPPQPGTAVGPSALSPGGHRTINMGMVDDVTPRPAQITNNPTVSTAAKTAQPWTGAPPTNRNVGPGGSREAQAFRNAAGNSFGDAAAASQNSSLVSKAGSALRTTGGLLAKGAGVVGAGMAAKDMYDNGANVGNSGDLLASGAAFAGPVGVAGAAGWGAGRAIGSNLSENTRDLIGGIINQGVRNVGELFGQDWGVDDSALLQQKAEARLATSNARTAPGAGGPAQSAPRSDQGPALPVEPGSYQSRRLSEMGVPLDVQNSNPVVNSATGSTRDFLRTGGTSQYQNLGTYGGNGNIYGKADDPSRPGRINNFVGVGAGASPANEANGSGSGGGVYGAVQSALRGLGNGPSAPGGSNSGGGPTMSVVGGNNDWYDQARKDILSSGVSVGRMTQQLVELANIRAGRENNRDTNAQSGANANLTAETARQNAERTERASLLNTLGEMERARATASSQTQAAQIKALQDAQKYNDDRQDKGEAATREWIKGRFTSGGIFGDEQFDSSGAAKFTDFLGSGKAMVGPPENRRPLMSLPPQERLAALPEVYQDWSVNEAMNSGGGLIGGGRTTNSPGKLVARPATVADLANGLPLGEYLGTKLVPGYESNVVERATDRKVRSVEAVAGDDLERKKAIMRNAGKE